MKTCRKCQQEREDDRYYKGSRVCKSCQVAAQQERRKNDPAVREQYLAYQKTYQTSKGREKRDERFEWLDEVKAAPCLDCQRTFPPECMDFDHRDPSTKLFDVSRAAVSGYSLQKVKEEVAKCDLLCACCHRIRTARQQRRRR